MRRKLRQLFLRWGYRIDCVRFVPRQMLDPASMISLDFHHAVCRRMVEVGRPLNFLQIGAFDGRTRDPLYPYIHSHNWRGIMVEPQERACDFLKILHAGNPHIQIVNAAIGRERGTAILYTVQGENLPEWCGGLASLSKESILKHRHLVPEIEDHLVAQEVNVMPFIDLFDSVGMKEQLDVLQIDAEGADGEILRLFPFNSSRPAIVHWEIKHLLKKEREDCLERLLNHGYHFASSGSEDMLAVLSL
jgi:FkbM family methyltransferase